MKLDRNINSNGRGKYALLLLRRLTEVADNAKVKHAIHVLESVGVIDWGITGTDKEFFLIRLKDKHAANALTAYASSADRDGDAEYASEILEMASRAGEASPFCKRPD